MRINQYVASRTGLSRRAVDEAINQNRISVNGVSATPGLQINTSDILTIDGRPITPNVKTQTIILNKPEGYVASRRGQGSKTIYNLLPAELHNLKPVGRLDKDSSGLILLTNDGKLAHQLTHPSFAKEKVYEVTLDRALEPKDKAKIESGVMLEDGISKFTLQNSQGEPTYIVRMHEGRNRQIRRTFEALGYKVIELHRIQFGPYKLEGLQSGKYKEL